MQSGSPPSLPQKRKDFLQPVTSEAIRKRLPSFGKHSNINHFRTSPMLTTPLRPRSYCFLSATANSSPLVPLSRSETGQILRQSDQEVQSQSLGPRSRPPSAQPSGISFPQPSSLRITSSLPLTLLFFPWIEPRLALGLSSSVWDVSEGTRADVCMTAQ